MAVYRFPFLKKAPFIKLLLSLITGILIQWCFRINHGYWWLLIAIGLISLLGFFFIPLFNRFRLQIINGLIIQLLFLSVGAIITWQKDIRNNKRWLGNYYKINSTLVVSLDEPLIEKTKSFKANATVLQLITDKKNIPVNGKIILYFKKDADLPALTYGSAILFKKTLQEIKNAGNPGGFDYKRHSLFRGITHQVYLLPDEFEPVPGKRENLLQNFIYVTRNNVLTILRKYIHPEKTLGLAEALLIGYKDDLDPALVQSYTNTGVVHLIAISGLHLGLIYWLLAKLFNPFRKQKRIRWLRPVFIITGLWLFTFLAGAQPSVLRSAFMFTLIVVGENVSRKTSVYNTLAISAFVLLCINPFWLWDVGFQLSYAAVISIIAFMRPIYNWFYIKNKLIDFIWKLNSVTLAAQVLTIPLSIYHFHQFPTLFLLTNFLAVPISSLVLTGEIVLCIVAAIPVLAFFTGNLLSALIWFMNTYIERVEMIPFSLWDGLQITLPQTIFLLFLAAGIAWWLIEKKTIALKISLFSLLFFVGYRSYSFFRANTQQKIIIYNIPRKRAIDFINSRNYFFIGDSDLRAEGFARNFHLKPARILFRINTTDQLPGLLISKNFLQYRGKNILLIDQPVLFTAHQSKPRVDLLILSKNPGVFMKQLAGSLAIKQVVFDGSVSPWKSASWKKDCDSLMIPWYDVASKGAFVMKF